MSEPARWEWWLVRASNYAYTARTFTRRAMGRLVCMVQVRHRMKMDSATCIRCGGKP